MGWDNTRYNVHMDLLGVDPRSELPPYEQVRRQIAHLIETGGFAAEERLPPIRRLAGALGLAVNTVARAYRELELAGLIDTDGRHGSTVASKPSEQRRKAVHMAREFLRQMRDLDVGDAEIVAILRREIEGVPTAS
jgi:DNA-binding transcriptional regulator YhcF (GntR family)